jgi:multidrug efflux pump subunit AcrA (membrane-fusion protein)
VVEVLVAVGDRVTAGQLLLRLEPQPPAGAGG